MTDEQRWKRINKLADTERPSLKQTEELVSLLEEQKKKDGKLDPEYEGILRVASILAKAEREVRDKPAPGRKHSLEDIIKAERYILSTLKPDDYIGKDYHEDIIFYLEELKREGEKNELN